MWTGYCRGTQDVGRPKGILGRVVPERCRDRYLFLPRYVGETRNGTRFTYGDRKQFSELSTDNYVSYCVQPRGLIFNTYTFCLLREQQIQSKVMKNIHIHYIHLLPISIAADIIKCDKFTCEVRLGGGFHQWYLSCNLAEKVTINIHIHYTHEL